MRQQRQQLQPVGSVIFFLFSLLLENDSTWAQPSLAPTLAPICLVCGPGQQVTNLDVTLSAIPGSTLQPTCLEYQQQGLTGQIPERLCPLATDIVELPCNCQPIPTIVTTPIPTPILTPIPTAIPTPIPSPIPTSIVVTPQPTQGPSCNVCNGIVGPSATAITAPVVTQPLVTLDASLLGVELTCEQLQTLGRNGDLDTAQCPFIPLLISDACACSIVATTPSPTQPPPTPIPIPASPLTSPPTLPPSPLPTVENACYLCGNAESQVMNPNRVLNLPRRSITPTCEQVQQWGLLGNLTRVDCLILPSFIQRECGCQAISEQPMPSPSPTATARVIVPNNSINNSQQTTATVPILPNVAVGSYPLCNVCGNPNLVVGQPLNQLTIPGSPSFPIACFELEQRGLGGQLSLVDCLVIRNVIQETCQCTTATTTTAPPTSPPFAVRFPSSPQPTVCTGSICNHIRPNLPTRNVTPGPTQAPAGTVRSSPPTPVPTPVPTPAPTPVPTTPQPTLVQPRCQTDANGLYASSSNQNSDVAQFLYQVQTDSRVLASTVQTTILPQVLEPALASLALLPSLFPADCAITTAVARAAVTENIFGNRQNDNGGRQRQLQQRRLDVIGFSSRPFDSIIVGENCVGIINNTLPCFVIDGAMTIFSDGTRDVQSDINRALTTLQSSMLDGVFDTLDTRIASVRFRTQPISPSPTASPTTAPPTNTTTRTTTVFPFWIWILVAVAVIMLIVILVLLFIYVRSRQSAAEAEREQEKQRRQQEQELLQQQQRFQNSNSNDGYQAPPSNPYLDDPSSAAASSSQQPPYFEHGGDPTTVNYSSLAPSTNVPGTINYSAISSGRGADNSVAADYSTIATNPTLDTFSTRQQQQQQHHKTLDHRDPPDVESFADETTDGGFTTGGYSSTKDSNIAPNGSGSTQSYSTPRTDLRGNNTSGEQHSFLSGV